MKHLVFGSTVIGLLCGAAVAGTVGFTGNPYQNGGGGEFTATPIGSGAGLTGLARDLSAGSFQTFCLERSEFITLNGTQYNYTINDRAIFGGVNSPPPDPISGATGYLYRTFRYGGVLPAPLGSYDTGRLANAGVLQNAIWYLEGEMTAGEAGADAVTLATNAIAIAGGNDAAFYNVKVLNPYEDLNGNGIFDWNDLNGDDRWQSGEGDIPKQSMLTLIPLPTGAGLALAGIGSLAIRRRRSLA